MSIRRISCAFVLGLSTLVPPSPAADHAPPEFQAALDYAAEQVEKGRVASVAAAVVQGDKVVWAEGFGLADRAAGRKATPDTIYRLASISKPFTATGLMVLVDRGKIDLDAPANNYLPGTKLRAPLGSPDAMTVRRIANHTSGLAIHYNFFYDGHEPTSMDETIRRYGFAAKEPGKGWEYSNFGFGVLGYITEIASGTPWRTFMEREVYDPLGMARTSDRVRPGRESDAAVPYTLDVGGRFVPVGPYEFDHPGASAVWSSANDMARFARMHMRGGELDGTRILSESATKAMQVPTGEREPGEASGIGWFVNTEKGRRCISHSGGMPGVSTLLRIFPDDGVATIVLINSEGFDVTRGISDRLADAVLPPTDVKKPEAKETGEKPGAIPQTLTGAWTGTIAHFGGDIPLTIEVKGPREVRAKFGDGREEDLVDVSFADNQLHAAIARKLVATQPYYHGQTTIVFRLGHRDGRLTGVAWADGAGYFRLPHWVDLSPKGGEQGAAVAAPTGKPGPGYDLILKGGRIVDGCGTPWYRADLAIRDGKIAAIGRLEGARAARTIDASELIVAPGFIDMMGQTAAPFLRDPAAGDNLLTQGITTINAGEGDSDAPLSGEDAKEAGWSTMAEFFAKLDSAGMPINMVQTVGHTQVRRIVLGDVDRQASPEELERMKGLVREGMEAGAIGLSTSLIYPPAVYASTEEIVALAGVAGEFGGGYYTHMRNEGDQLLEAIDEALTIGDRAKTPVHIFHLKTAGQANWPKMDLAIAKIKAARAAGRQVGADVYPYLNNGLGIEALIHPRHSAEGDAALRRKLDDPAVRAEIRREMEGSDPWENWYRHVGRDWDNVIVGRMQIEPYKSHNGQSLAAVAKATGKDPWDIFFEVAKTGGFALPRTMSEANKIKAMQQEFTSFDTDAGPVSSSTTSTHPRAFGAFPRVLSRYVRELGVLSLEGAIARMTAVAANELGIRDRGRLLPGQAADIVVFDFDRIRDRATLAEPAILSEGMQFVIVNGRLVLDGGKRIADAHPGRVLRGPGYRTDEPAGD